MDALIKVIIRIDDICDRFDFYNLRDWFLSNFPQIPVAFYVMATQYSYTWRGNIWNKIKEIIVNNKWEIGGHSRNHPFLSQISNARQKSEILNNIQDIETNLNFVGLNYKITSFAYPYGDFDENIKRILKENNIPHGLTYVSDKNYKSQIKFPKDNLHEIGISCNASNSIKDWNERFKLVYEKGDSYILCLHTSHWIRGRNRKNIIRILKSRSIKELYFAIRRFLFYLFKKSSLYMWDTLRAHLEYILTHSNIQFITFKDLLE